MSLSTPRSEALLFSRPKNLCRAALDQTDLLDIVQALKEYKSGDRTHKTMHAQASSLSDQQMQDIAAYFASLGAAPAKPQ